MLCNLLLMKEMSFTSKAHINKESAQQDYLHLIHEIKDRSVKSKLLTNDDQHFKQECGQLLHPSIGRLA